MENKIVKITGDEKSINLLLKHANGLIKKFGLNVEISEPKKTKKDVSKS